MRKIGGACLALAVFLSAGVWAEPDSIRVLAAAGTVEINRASEGRWVPLAVSSHPVSGDRIRTGAKSSVDFAFDSSVNGMARLGEGSAALIESPLTNWRLERGRVWVLWEYETSSHPPFWVQIGSLRIGVDEGAYIQKSGEESEVRAFGDVRLQREADRRPAVLSEGYRQVFLPEREPERLTFSDYQDWRTWMTEAYKLKDSLTGAVR